MGGWTKTSCNGDGTCNFENSTGQTVTMPSEWDGSGTVSGTESIDGLGDFQTWSGGSMNWSSSADKPKKEKKQRYDPFSQALIGSINSFTQSIINGASIKDALQGSLQQLVGGISQGIAQTIAESMPGPGGGILGALGGGLFGILASKIFKIGRKKKEQKKPLIVEVANFPELVKMFTMPSSYYFHPTGMNRSGSIIQNNSSVINVQASPKVADTVQRALTAPIFLSQRKRGLAY